MLHKLFGKNSGKSAHAPDGRRIYAIGDIHGCAVELGQMLDLITEDIASTDLAGKTFGGSENKAASDATILFLGDYVDRGPDSKGVIDRLIALGRERPDTVFLKGNHEAAMLDFLAAPRLHAEWLHWGGAETLESYGLANVWSRDEKDLANDLNEALPHDHRAFLEALELIYEAGDYLFVHAGLKPGVALEDQEADDLLWIRSEFHNTPVTLRPDKTIIHGHHPVKKPQDSGWRVNVDTGACWSGKLTAVALEGAGRRFLST